MAPRYDPCHLCGAACGSVSRYSCPPWRFSLDSGRLLHAGARSFYYAAVRSCLSLRPLPRAVTRRGLSLTAEAGAGLLASLAGQVFRVGQRAARSLPERRSAKFRREDSICWSKVADARARLRWCPPRSRRSPHRRPRRRTAIDRGLAVAYRHYSLKYVPNEDQAKSAKRGLWAGTFEMPREYRARTLGGENSALLIPSNGTCSPPPPDPRPPIAELRAISAGIKVSRASIMCRDLAIMRRSPSLPRRASDTFAPSKKPSHAVGGSGHRDYQLPGHARPPGFDWRPAGTSRLPRASAGC